VRLRTFRVPPREMEGGLRFSPRSTQGEAEWCRDQRVFAFGGGRKGGTEKGKNIRRPIGGRTRGRAYPFGKEKEKKNRAIITLVPGPGGRGKKTFNKDERGNSGAQRARNSGGHNMFEGVVGGSKNRLITQSNSRRAERKDKTKRAISIGLGERYIQCGRAFRGDEGKEPGATRLIGLKD